MRIPQVFTLIRKDISERFCKDTEKPAKIAVLAGFCIKMSL